MNLFWVRAMQQNHLTIGSFENVHLGLAQGQSNTFCTYNPIFVPTYAPMFIKQQFRHAL